MSDARRAALLGLVAALVMTASAWLVRHAGVAHATSAATAPASPLALAERRPATTATPPAASRLHVAAVSGKAERQRGADVQRLAVGDGIEGDDYVATAPGASVEIENGTGGTRLNLGSSSRVRVDAIGDRETALTVERGRLRATSRQGERVHVRDAAGAGTAHSEGGDFTLQAETDGTLRVVSHQNRVTLIARDETLSVEPGSGAVVRRGEAVRREKLPSALLLRVRWPDRHEQRERELAVSGETAPGALVRSGGSEAIADAEGRFTIHIPLREGRNQPRLSTEDLAGRRVAARGHAVDVDSRVPLIHPEGLSYGP